MNFDTDEVSRDICSTVLRDKVKIFYIRRGNVEAMMMKRTGNGSHCHGNDHQIATLLTVNRSKWVLMHD